MDWLLDTRHTVATAAAVEALDEHLLRHTANEATVPAALARAEQTLRSLPVGDADVLWMHLDWTRIHPTLLLWPVPADYTEAPDSGFAPVSADLRPDLTAVPSREGTSVDLAVPREVSLSFDPEVGSIAVIHPLTDGPACVAVAMGAAAELHPVASPDQVAGAAGALIADAALSSVELTGVHDAVDRFIELLAALGGAAHAVSVEPDRIELAVERCPFGDAVKAVPSLARLVDAMAGRIAARVHGTATVVHDESIAHGDRIGRLQVFLTEPDEEVLGSTFTWPPSGTVERSDPSPRLEMSVSLPRQSHSVPVIRRLSAQILRAFGAASDSIHDVELAISEACANVIQHAGESSDGYEVSIELASDRCAITVLDRGEGFDAARVRDQHDDDAESGRGLTLMRALVDNLNFVSEPKVGAVVHMVKALDYDQDHPFRRSRTA